MKVVVVVEVSDISQPDSDYEMIGHTKDVNNVDLSRDVLQPIKL